MKINKNYFCFQEAPNHIEWYISLVISWLENELQKKEIEKKESLPYWSVLFGSVVQIIPEAPSHNETISLFTNLFSTYIQAAALLL